jgi:hypothetical protein
MSADKTASRTTSPVEDAPSPVTGVPHDLGILIMAFWYTKKALKEITDPKPRRGASRALASQLVF